MLKFLVWILLAANVVLFVFQQTYFDAPSPGKREPERLTQQYNEDRIRLLSEDEVSRALSQAAAMGTRAKPDAVAAPVASAPHSGSICVEIGNFSKEDATGFQRQLHQLALPAENISLATLQESSTWMVFLPPAANAGAAEANAAALKQKGISSYYIIKDQSKLKWAVSLGVFRSHDSAVAFAAELKAKGIPDIQLAPRGTPIEKFVFRLDSLNDGQLKTLESLLGNFPAQSLRHCAPPVKSPA